MGLEPKERSGSSLVTCVLLACIPAVTFLVIIGITEVWINPGDGTGPFLAAFIVMPSLFPIFVARGFRARMLTVAAMTAVAIFAAVAMVTSDDAQRGLAVLYVPYAAIPLGFLLLIARSVGDRIRRRNSPGPPVAGRPQQPASTAERFSALLLDAILLGAPMFLPLKNVSGAGREWLAAVAGFGVAGLYFGGFVAARGQTFGHWIIGIRVTCRNKDSSVSFLRAFVRGLIIAFEVIASVTLFGAVPALAEVFAAATTGHSLTDRLLRTEVVRV